MSAVSWTATALQRARTVHRLDDEAQREIARAEPARLTAGEAPVLIDEWQRLPESWDAEAYRREDGIAVIPAILLGP